MDDIVGLVDRGNKPSICIYADCPKSLAHSVEKLGIHIISKDGYIPMFTRQMKELDVICTDISASVYCNENVEQETSKNYNRLSKLYKFNLECAKKGSK